MVIEKSTKKAIIASLIASILFFLFIEPFMRLIWKFLNTTGLTIYSKYLDTIYLSAALGHRNDIDFLLLTFVLITIIIIIIAALIDIFLSRRFNKIKREINENNTVDEIKNKLQENLKRHKYLNKTQKSLSYSIIILTPFFIIACFLGVFQAYVDLQLNTSFNQRMNALAPYMEDSQKKVLTSKWALMKSKNDYYQIKYILENVAKNNNIELPEALIK